MTMISVCMIVKDEEDIIRQAIDSTVGLADEIVALDTGSTDSTVELLEQLGVQVLTGGDRMHKGQSRNRVMDAASGEWNVVLDADERIADPVGLRKYLESTDAQALFIKLAYVNSNGDPTLSYQQMRCWRRGTYEYKYRAHEVPEPTNGWGSVEYTDFVWEHRPPPDRMWKSDYTLNRLLLDVEEHPGDTRPLYYLGRQYMYREEWQMALDKLAAYLEKPGRDEADAWHGVALCHHGLGQEKEHISALFQACAAAPHRREWWGELAAYYHGKGQESIAVGLLKCALEQPPPPKSYVKHYWHGSHIYDLLARCLWKLKRYEEGKEYASTAVKLSPDDTRLRRNLKYFDDILISEPAP